MFLPSLVTNEGRGGAVVGFGKSKMTQVFTRSVGRGRRESVAFVFGVAVLRFAVFRLGSLGAVTLGLLMGASTLAVAGSASSSGMSIGQTFSLSPGNLPAPYSAPAVGFVGPTKVRPDGIMPHVPKGFDVNVYASGLNGPREMVVGADGTLYVAETREGKVLALRDSDGDGRVDMRVTLVGGFREPSGLALHGAALYVADRRAVWRIGFDGETMKALPRVLVTRPGALGTGGGHITREIVFAPDGKHFYVAIGSQTNVGEDPLPRATIQQFRINGTAQSTYATGLRSPVGMGFYPGTNDLYAVVNERFGLGAGLVPDYFTRVVRNGFYGFPYAYLGPHPDPQFGELRPDLVKIARVPDVLFAPHSGPFGLLFVQGEGLPPAWNGDALVALHGTQADGGTAGFAIVRVGFHQGRPIGDYQTVMTGFGRGKSQTGGVWGRPVWLARTKDGALLVSDDVANVIWRVTWHGNHVASSSGANAKVPSETAAIVPASSVSP